MTQNYDFSCQLLDQAMNSGCHFQYASSASVYGLGSEFAETSAVDPRTPYAWSKYMFERYAARMQEYADHCNYRIQGFRYFNVYGPEGEEHKGRQASPFAQFKQQAHNTGQVEVFDVDSHRDFVHVSQVVDTHQKFFNVNESGVWNVGTGRTMSFREIAYLYTDNVVTVPMPSVLKDSYQIYTCANVTKLEHTLARY
jgi:ADP-L-glycero-D-manno-heptose 6-epimerase